MKAASYVNKNSIQTGQQWKFLFAPTTNALFVIKNGSLLSRSRTFLSYRARKRFLERSNEENYMLSKFVSCLENTSWLLANRISTQSSEADFIITRSISEPIKICVHNIRFLNFVAAKERG